MSPATRLYQNPGLVDTYGPNNEIRNGEWRLQVSQHIMIRTETWSKQSYPSNYYQRDKLRDYFLTEEGKIMH